jgi:hypothetical protein
MSRINGARQRIYRLVIVWHCAMVIAARGAPEGASAPVEPAELGTLERVPKPNCGDSIFN